MLLPEKRERRLAFGHPPRENIIFAFFSDKLKRAANEGPGYAGTGSDTAPASRLRLKWVVVVRSR